MSAETNTKESATVRVDVYNSDVLDPESRLLVPGLEIIFPRGAHYRLATTALFEIAAAVSEATEPQWGWRIEIERLADFWGRVYLDLMDGDAAEIEAANLTLHKALETWKSRRAAATSIGLHP